MNDDRIDYLIAQRNKLLQRRDGLYSRARIDAIDAKLSTVPEGQRNDVDQALGRLCAEPTPRVEYSAQSIQHMHQCGWCGEWYIGARVDHGCPPPPVSAMEQDYIDSFDAPRPGYFASASVTIEAVKPLADQMVSVFDAEMRRLCADYDIEAPDYPGMWM